MPEIFDNIDKSLFEALQKNLQDSERADFCVGYFNLRGWQKIDNYIEKWSGKNGECCRLLIGMQKLPQEELRDSLNALHFGDSDKVNGKAVLYDLKRSMAKDFRDQLMLAYPTKDDGKGLRRLAGQLRSKKVVVKLFVRYLLHAKLYLLHGDKIPNSMIGYVGSSNLTFAGLSRQGELNIDVADVDTCKKLTIWFNDLWDDDLCIDISDDLLEVINESWAREEPIPPYHIYIKIAYHLAYEARAGSFEFNIPEDLQDELLEFQKAAIKIASRHLKWRGGVILGDVVGLGKTLMATALVKIFSNNNKLKTLIICPRNLIKMWESYVEYYNLHAKVISIGMVKNELPHLDRYHLVVIDESHYLRNRFGKRYKVIRDYIHKNESKCILLSATPYNKDLKDLSSQLRLFIPDDKDIGIRPERLIREKGESVLTGMQNRPLSSLAAFEESEHPDDWRDLMGLYLVRRTRSFIRKHYAKKDEESGREYLEIKGENIYFPERIPRTIKFKVNEDDDNDSYARLFNDEIINAISSLKLPRYDLGKYISDNLSNLNDDRMLEFINEKLPRDRPDQRLRLMGFCRTNLLKRMESSGHAFILSLKHHILRNYVLLYALKEQKALPIGSMSVKYKNVDFDESYTEEDIYSDDEVYSHLKGTSQWCKKDYDFMVEAENIHGSCFKLWEKGNSSISSKYFNKVLQSDLQDDCNSLQACLEKLKDWKPEEDEKLKSLKDLILNKHPTDKILIFSQYSDTINYLHTELKKEFEKKNISTSSLDWVTGDRDNPIQIACRFSPESNSYKKVTDGEVVRVLLTTDVLSEGQNLQDAHIVVNYDLPWAIIRLIQRAGRVDRLGQKWPKILCYSFLPENRIEEMINLRKRVHQRLQTQSEVVGTDERFFEDEEHEQLEERDKQLLENLYNEKAGILDGENNENDEDVDLSSQAYQIWKNAIQANPSLERKIERMQDVVYSSKHHIPEEQKPEGVLVYVRSVQSNSLLAWVDIEGNSVTGSQFEILQAAACEPETKVLPPHDKHHDLVTIGAKHIAEEEIKVYGVLGDSTKSRARVFHRLDKYLRNKETISENIEEIKQAQQDMRDYILTDKADEILSRQLGNRTSDKKLILAVLDLYHDGELCKISEGRTDRKEPKIICSMGLWK